MIFYEISEKRPEKRIKNFTISYQAGNRRKNVEVLLLEGFHDRELIYCAKSVIFDYCLPYTMLLKGESIHESCRSCKIKTKTAE